MSDADFKVTDLDYDLPGDRIAQHPLDDRDRAKLLVVDRSRDLFLDRTVADLPDLLDPRDLLILNDTRVVPARFTAYRRTGGKIGGLFLRQTTPRTWEVMLEGARRCRAGETLLLRARSDNDVPLQLVEDQGTGLWIVRPQTRENTEAILERVGHTPLPPYIRRPAGDAQAWAPDRIRYQTVFAQKPGAVAAPTAGLHFTWKLLDRLRARGIATASLTLHVGLGTFKPISAQHLTDHVMHEEWFDLPTETAGAVRTCRGRGGRVVAVGTTALRTLEACADESQPGLVRAASGTTGLFIYPPRRPRVADAVLTNFHLPRTTLLALVMATAGVARIKAAYAHAVKSGYRFYSYGDAMLIV